MVKYQSLIYNHSTTWHDGCVALLLSDGRIVDLASERVDRKKHSWDSRVAYEYLQTRYPRAGFGTRADYFKDVSKNGLDRTNHHLYHASNVFFASPFDEAGILVIDGQGPEKGKLASTSIWKGYKDRIDLVEIPFLSKGNFAARSLGHFYTAIGALAGMQSLYEEGKTMGLASYGRPSRFLDFIRKYAYSNPDGTFNIEPDFVYALLGNTFGPKYYMWKRQPKRRQQIWDEFMKIRGKPLRQSFEEVTREDMDIAYAGQIVLEEIVCGLTKRVKKLTGADNICLAGGVALNGVVNSCVRDSGLFKEVYIFPASGDDGQAVGKLFYHIHSQGIDFETATEKAFYGPVYTKKEIETAIKKFKKEIRVIGSGERFTINEVVDRLIDGEVIGRFSGGCEIGPRALGHRSIIADPRIDLMKDYVNSTVKNREWYRPLAPSVTEDNAKDFFEIETISPFMLFMNNVIPEKRKVIPAVTHIDGSARVQTVSKSQDLSFYELIKKFGQKTGIPVLLNTSFNRRNEPLIESPENALETFVAMDLDALILEEFLIVKRGV